MNPLRLAAPAWLALLMSVPVWAGPQGRAPRPNIILINADDLGYGDLGCYGQERIATPHIDALAARGMRMLDHYAGSTVCAPSRAVLMTGLHTGHTRIRGNKQLALLDEEYTLPEMLQEAGYATGGFGKWGLGNEDSSGAPTRQGFDEFFGWLDQAHAHNPWPHYLVDGTERIHLPNVVPSPSRRGAGVATDKQVFGPFLVAERASAWVRSAANEGRPFFLYFPMILPHANNEAGKAGMEAPDIGEWQERDWPAPQKGHAGYMRVVDDQVGALVALVDELGLADSTLFVFTSDNGAHREGGFDPAARGSSGPLRGIKRSLHDGGIRVPTIVTWPGHVPPGSVTRHVSYHGDYFQTFADLAGQEAPAGLDSISMLPTWTKQGEGQRQHTALYFEFHERRGGQALRFGNWKAVRVPWWSNVQLFDLSVDLAEQHDLAAEEPERLAQALALLKSSRVASDLFQDPPRPPAATAADGDR